VRLTYKEKKKREERGKENRENAARTCPKKRKGTIAHVSRGKKRKGGLLCEQDAGALLEAQKEAPRPPPGGEGRKKSGFRSIARERTEKERSAVPREKILSLSMVLPPPHGGKKEFRAPRLFSSDRAELVGKKEKGPRLPWGRKEKKTGRLLQTWGARLWAREKKSGISGARGRKKKKRERGSQGPPTEASLNRFHP